MTVGADSSFVETTTENRSRGKVRKDNEAAAVFIGKSRLKVVLPML